MQTKANTLKSQRGGSTLIGLVLGLCLGMLALIKWPQLEVPIRRLLAEHDIELAVAGASDRDPRSISPVSRSSALDIAKRATPTQMPANNGSQIERTDLGAVSESQLAAHRAPTGGTDIAHTDMAFAGAQQASGQSADIAKAEAMGSAQDAQTTLRVADSSLSAQPGALQRDVAGYETREVWQAFSSESAAAAFATVVSNALNIEVQTLRHSDHKIVPIVRCGGRRECDAMRAEITAFLAGSSESEVYDEI